MADYLPKFDSAGAITYTASDAVVGGRLVEVSGARQVAHAGAASVKVVGVAARDAKGGEKVLVYGGAVQRLTISAAVVAGARVAAAADGKAATATSGQTSIGLALTGGTDANDVIEVLMSDLRIG